MILHARQRKTYMARAFESESAANDSFGNCIVDPVRPPRHDAKFRAIALKATRDRE
jgi:hypothetical protein